MKTMETLQLSVYSLGPYENHGNITIVCVLSGTIWKPWKNFNCLCTLWDHMKTMETLQLSVYSLGPFVRYNTLSRPGPVVKGVEHISTNMKVNIGVPLVLTVRI